MEEESGSGKKKEVERKIKMEDKLEKERKIVNAQIHGKGNGNRKT
jgi:hypothetical protein